GAGRRAARPTRRRRPRRRAGSSAASKRTYVRKPGGGLQAASHRSLRQAGAYSFLMRLLLVEDEPKMARALARGLRSEGYAVDVAGDGDNALLNARVYDYDAVVLDVMIPGPDGLEVCRTLRQEDRWP